VGARAAAVGTNLIAELPGSGDEWIVVCAHYDGHDLAQSAVDNATGVAAALAVLREFASRPRRRRGLRVILFTAEESGLLGSRRYVESLGDGERRQIQMVINLDTVAGSPDLAALTSGFAQLDEFVSRFGLRRVGGLLRNSDHFNFAQAGIPALRLVAGFDQPESDVRYLLTQGDTADRVSPRALERGAAAALALADAALT
jgi:Zn-dependent M28 family amino/carboxypeptidase